MFRTSVSLLLFTLVLVGCEPSEAEHSDDHAMEAAEEPAIIAHLKAGQEAFHEMMMVSADQWTFQESPERWALAGIAEHLIKTEQSSLEGLRDGVLASEPSEPQANPDSTDGFITMILSDRSQTFTAPDNLTPEGIYATPEEAIAAFDESRNALIALAAEHLDVLRMHQMEHPVGSTLDAHQWILFVTAHAARHLDQAAQVKAHEGYPAM